MTKMWMIRGESGRLYDDFRERGVVAIGWSQLAPLAKPGMSRKEVTRLYQDVEPNIKPATAISGASQVWRFINEIQPGDWVVTYSPANRTYLVGKITGDFKHNPDLADLGMSLTRPVQWIDQEVDRDSLTSASKTASAQHLRCSSFRTLRPRVESDGSWQQTTCATASRRRISGQRSSGRYGKSGA